MITEILNHGAENAISTESIMMKQNLNKRDVVAAVSAERAAGFPILSSSHGGYYLPDDEDPSKALAEVTECINTIQSRGLHTLAALKTLKEEKKRLEGVVGREVE